MKIDYQGIVARIGQLNLIHRIYIHRVATENGIYFGQLPILEYVSSHGQCTQSELAETLQVSAPSIATSVKRMQKTGLLKKTVDESDLRYNRISITEKGIDLARKCRSGFDTVDARMFEGFSVEECEKFSGYLERLIANIAAGEFENRTFLALINTAAAEKNQHVKQKKEEYHD